MAYFEFLWTPEAIEHVAENDITQDEFEDVVSHPNDIQHSKSSGRPSAFGYARDGRLILCVYEQVDELTVLPVTAFYLEDAE